MRFFNSQVQDFAFAFVKIHEFSVKKFLQLVKAPLNGSPGPDKDVKQLSASALTLEECC